MPYWTDMESSKQMIAAWAGFHHDIRLWQTWGSLMEPTWRRRLTCTFSVDAYAMFVHQKFRPQAPPCRVEREGIEAMNSASSTSI
jgi:uncharacterized membrane protein